MEVLRSAWRSEAGLLTPIAATIVATMGGAFWLVEGGALLAVAGIPLALVLMLVRLYRHYAHRYYIEASKKDALDCWAGTSAPRACVTHATSTCARAFWSGSSASAHWSSAAPAATPGEEQGHRRFRRQQQVAR